MKLEFSGQIFETFNFINLLKPTGYVMH